MKWRQKMGIREPVGAAITFRERPGKIISIVKELSFSFSSSSDRTGYFGEYSRNNILYNYLFLKIPAWAG